MTTPKHDAIEALEKIACDGGLPREVFDPQKFALDALQSLRSGQHEGGDDVHACACKFVGDTCIDICAYHQDLEKQNLNLTSRLEDFGAELAKLHNEKLGYKATPPQGEATDRQGPEYLTEFNDSAELASIMEKLEEDHYKYEYEDDEPEFALRLTMKEHGAAIRAVKQRPSQPPVDVESLKREIWEAHFKKYPYSPERARLTQRAIYQVIDDHLAPHLTGAQGELLEYAENIVEMIEADPMSMAAVCQASLEDLKGAISRSQSPGIEEMLNNARGNFHDATIQAAMKGE